MKKMLLASAALVAVFGTPAFAGDLIAPAPAYSSGQIVASPPMAPPPIVERAPVVRALDWTGAYFGGILGYTSGDVSGNSGQFTVLNSPLRPNVDGFNGGVSTGFNWQYNQVIFGVVADIVGSSTEGSKSSTATLSGGQANGFFGVNGFAGPTSVNAKVDTRNQYVGTVRGKVGYAWFDSPVMLYGTAGFGFGDMQMRLSASGNDGVSYTAVSAAETKTLFGYAVGAGVETMLDRNFSLGFEYLYIDLGKANYLSSSYGNGIDAGLTTHNARVNLNYHF